jgi:hypothetical protein
MLRSAKEWAEIFETAADQPGGSVAAAARILDDLTGYPASSRHKRADAEQLASALAGWRCYMDALGE